MPTVIYDVLVTGASGTIGEAIARRLAKAGYRVHGAGRDGGRLRRLQKDLRGLGAPAEIDRFSLGDRMSGVHLIERFFKRAERPYALVCAAGHLGPVGRFWETSMEEWQKSIQENFFSHVSMIHAFARAMARHRYRRGAIVVFSGAGIGAGGNVATVSSYSTAKAALVHLTEALAPDLQSLGLTINAIAPGPVLSRMTEQTLRAGKRCGSGFRKSAAQCKKSGGVSPDLAAQMTEFLLSPAARRLTGRLLSARFDLTAVRKRMRALATDDHAFRLRRVDDVLFERKVS